MARVVLMKGYFIYNLLFVLTGNIYIAPEKHTGIVRTLYFLINILLFVGLNACSGKPKISPVLTEAERLMNVRVDSLNKNVVIL